MNFQELSASHWLSSAHVSILSRLPWKGDNGLAAVAGADVLALLSGASKVDEKWPQVQVIPFSEGGFGVISPNSLLELDADGDFVSKIELSETGESRKLIKTRAGFLLLRAWADGKCRLSLLDSDGLPKWERAGKAYAFEHLLSLGESAFGIRMVGEIAAFVLIDLKNGALGTEIPGPIRITPVFQGGKGKVCFLSANPQTRKRYWNWLSLGESPVSRLIPDDIFGLFSFPIGSDGQLNGYGVSGNEVGKFAVDGSNNWKMNIETLIPAEDGQFWFSEQDAGRVRIYQWNLDAPAQVMSLEIPVTLREKFNDPAWRLIRVRDGQFFFSGRDPRNYVTHFVVWNSEDDSFAETALPGSMAEFGTYLQGSRSWAISPDGALILPVATPEALTLVKIILK